jgi:hypothetical protein
LVQIDPNTLETTSYELSTVSSLWPTSLNITPDGNTLYFLGNGVHQVKLNTDIQDQLLIDLEGVYMKINPANGELWIAQSNEFQDENKLVQFSANGVWKREYKLGNQPLTMAFIP